MAWPAYPQVVPFAPAAAIELSTPLPKAPPAIVSTVTQAEGESAIATLRVSFPSAFGFNERFHPARCQPDDEATRSCPEASKIGTIAAQSSFGPAAGSVYIADDFRLLAFADAFNGIVQIKAVGAVTVTPEDGFAVTFSGLPDLPLQAVRLSLDGDDKGLLKNPPRCATYTLPTHFVSHAGEQSDATPTVTISGCVAPVSALRASRSGRSVTLRWTQPEADETEVRLRRGARTVATRRTAASSLRFSSLAPGRYSARVRAFAAGRGSPPRTLRFRVPR
jgi:hypothetical protein